MRSVLEEGLGIPQGPPRPAPGAAIIRKGKGRICKSRGRIKEAQRNWRLTLPMQKYTDMRKMYNDAGVNIHISKFATSTWSDEEIDYAFNAAKGWEHMA